MASRDVNITLKANIAGYMAALATARKGTGDFASELNAGAKKGGAGFTALSTGALAFGTAAAAGIGLAVTRFAQFDQAMSQVEAATHASVSVMNQFEQAAIEAGAASVFSATEAAQGIEALAKAGVNAQDILGGGLTGALDLAAAGELEVGNAAEIAATAMTQFNLSGSEVPHIADLLAAGAGKAQGEVTDLAAALNQSGLVASQMGLSIEETTGTLAAFASAGLIGSDAGTSFRTMLLRLANPSQEAASLMSDLGISAYDAQGQFVGMEALAGQLRDKLGGLTQQQRDSTLATLFGSDAIRGANVLYNQGADGIQNWINKVDDQGYASETAAMKTDNLIGDIERLGGALDSALIQSGSAANETLRFLAQGATDLIDSFTDLPGWVQAAATGLVAVTAAAGLAGGAYGLAAPRIAAANAALIATGPAGAAASRGLTFAAKAAGILAAAWVAVEVGGSLFRQWTGDVVAEGNAAAGVLRDIASSGDISKSSMEALGASTATFDEAMQAAFSRNALDNGVAFFNQLGSLGGNLPWGDDAVDEANRFFSSVDAGLSALVSNGRGEEAGQVFRVISERAAESGATVADIARALPQYADAIAGSMDSANAALESAVQTGSAEELASSIAAAQAAIELGGLSAAEAAEQFPLLGDAMTILALIAPDLAAEQSGVTDEFTAGADAADSLSEAMDRLTGNFKTHLQAVSDFEQAYDDAFALIADQANQGLGALDNALDEVTGGIDQGTQAGRDLADAFLTLTQGGEDVIGALVRMGDTQGAIAAETGLRDSLMDAAETAGLSAEAATALVNSLIGIPGEYVADIVVNLPGSAGAGGTDLPQAVQDLLGGLSIGVPAFVDLQGGLTQEQVDAAANVNGPFSQEVGLSIDETAALQELSALTGVPYLILLQFYVDQAAVVDAAADAEAAAKAAAGAGINIPFLVNPAQAESDIGEFVSRPRKLDVVAGANVTGAESAIGGVVNTAWATTVTTGADTEPAKATIGGTTGYAWKTTIVGYGDAGPAAGEIGRVANTNWRSSITAAAATGDAEGKLNYAARNRTSTVTQVLKVARAGGGPVGHAGGGPVTGPGTNTSDSIDIRASTGEYVNNANSTALNRAELDAANFGGAKLMIAPGYAGGGPVGERPMPAYAAFGSSSAQADLRQLGEQIGALAARAIVIENQMILDGRVAARSTNRINARDGAR